MNIHIISTNRNSHPFPVMPNGASIVAEAARRAGHRVTVLDLMMEREPLDAVEATIRRGKPDVIGLSIRNIDNNDMHNPVLFLKELRPLMKRIETTTDATVVLGGSAVAVMPEQILRYTGASWAMRGEGETIFPEFLRKLSRNETPKELPGISWVEDDLYRENSCLMTESPDELFCPDFERWFDVREYLSRLSAVPVQSKRGCHFQCIYCTYGKIEGSTYRLYDPDSVVAFVRRLASTGVRDIEFVDNLFNFPYEHAMAICEKLACERPHPRLQTVELHPRFIDHSLLTTMEQAGFVGIGITAESVSDRVLRGLRKGFTAEDVQRACQVVNRHTIPCLWIFMLGGPGETEASIRETLRFAESSLRPKDVAFFGLGVRVYPGTELETIMRREGHLTFSPQEMLEPVFYLSPEVDAHWMVQEVRKSVDKNMNFIDSHSVGLSFMPTIHRLGHRLGMRSPMWRYTRFIRRGLKFVGVHA